MCYSISGVRQTDTSLVVLAGIVVYVVVVWQLVGGGLTSNSRAEPSRSLTGGWPLGAGSQSVLVCRLMNPGCALHTLRLSPPAGLCPHCPLLRLLPLVLLSPIYTLRFSNDQVDSVFLPWHLCFYPAGSNDDGVCITVRTNC